MKKKTSSRVSSNQANYLRYIGEHPGCSVADVDRACRTNPRAGHKWVYDGVSRLRRRGLVVARPNGAALALYLPIDAAMAADRAAGADDCVVSVLMWR